MQKLILSSKQSHIASFCHRIGRWSSINAILVYILALHVLPSLAVGAEINKNFLYPVDRAAVGNSNIMAVGYVLKTSSPPARLLVKNNDGEVVNAVQIIGKGWSAKVQLTGGLNDLILINGSGKELSRHKIYYLSSGQEPVPTGFKRYYLHTKNELATYCADCHTDGDPTRPNYRHIEQKKTCLSGQCHVAMQIKKKFQHGPMAEGSCVECHNPHGSVNKKYLKASRSDLCFSCHTDLPLEFDKKVVHYPVARGECLACHDPHQSDLEFHLKRGSIKEVCKGCHGDRVTSHKVMHEPVAEGDCSACHNPHVSDNKALLVESGNEMCFACHEVRKDEFKRKFIHKPVKEDCTNCHDPHGSATVKHLKTKVDANGVYQEEEQPVKEACLLCHRKLNPKITKQIEHAKVGHKPVTMGRCLICHTPHSSNFPKQLRAAVADICYACHKDMAKHIKNSRFKHGPIRQKDCQQCHQVHGSQFKYLLTARFDSKFAGDFKLDKYRLCLNCHSDKVYTETESMETGFRNGKQNLHYLHVNEKKSGCKTCHEIHASNQEKHIRAKSLFRNRYKIKMQFIKTDTGGTCMVGCHPLKKYDRDTPVNNTGKKKR